MKLKHLAFASMLAASALSAHSAATSPGGDMGTIGSQAELFGGLMSGGAFSDQYEFSLAQTSYVSGSVAEFFGTVSFSAVSLDGSFTPLTPTTTGFGFSFANLAAGDYMLTVSGTSSGLSSYVGTLSATPIPEPQSLAMLLAGLGAMGAVAIRRRERG